MASSLVQTLSSLSTQEDVFRYAKNVKVLRLAPSQRETQTSKEQIGSTELVVPKHLYVLIQEALLLEEQKKEDKREQDVESKLQDVLTLIDKFATFYRNMESLPSDWKYHPDTAGICVPETYTVPAAKKNPDDIPCNPHLESVPLDERGQKAWREFKKRDEEANITALRGICYPTPDEAYHPLLKTSDWARYVSDFAVEVFNKIYQLYINKGNKKNISNAEIGECKYIKYEEGINLFYVTLAAFEQMNHGVYETTIKCASDDGAITLDTFALMDCESPDEGAKFSPEIKYEILTDGSEDEDIFYPVSGMVRRSDVGGGYDFFHIHGSNRWMGY